MFTMIVEFYYVFASICTCGSQCSGGCTSPDAGKEFRVSKACLYFFFVGNLEKLRGPRALMEQHGAHRCVDGDFFGVPEIRVPLSGSPACQHPPCMVSSVEGFVVGISCRGLLGRRFSLAFGVFPSHTLVGELEPL